MYFMNNQFVQSAVKQVGSPEILVNVISKRVRQLGQGFRPLIEVHPRWTFLDIALREVSEGKIICEMIEDPKVAAPVKKTRKSAKD
jgi:DNA-directed RNA polymerase subunit omega